MRCLRFTFTFFFFLKHSWKYFLPFFFFFFIAVSLLTCSLQLPSLHFMLFSSSHTHSTQHLPISWLLTSSCVLTMTSLFTTTELTFDVANICLLLYTDVFFFIPYARLLAPSNLLVAAKLWNLGWKVINKFPW